MFNINHKKNFYIDEILFIQLKKISDVKQITLNKLINSILKKDLYNFKPFNYDNELEENKQRLQIYINNEIENKLKTVAKTFDLSETEIIRQILKKHYFSNNFIKLKKPLYFNVKELLNNKETKAILKEPINNLHEYYKLYYMPTNLDKWSNKHNSYCYNDNINKHKGGLLESFCNKIFTSNLKELNRYFIYFEYTLKNNIEIVTLKLINIDDYLLLNNDQLLIYLLRDENIIKQINKNVLSIDKYINQTFNINYANKNNINNIKDVTIKNMFKLMNARFNNRWILKPYKIEKIKEYYIKNRYYVKLHYKESVIYISYLDFMFSDFNVIFTPNNYIKLLMLVETFVKNYNGIKPISY